MTRVTVSELRENLRRYLDHVRAGGRVLVLDRNRPVAEIIPVTFSQKEPGVDDARLATLEREGLISRGTSCIPSEVLRPTSIGKGAKVLKALLEERAASA